MYVLTIKPQTNYFEKLVKLFELGFVNFRINFARGSVDENYNLIREYKNFFKSKNQQCLIFVDLPGYKIRLGSFVNGSEMLTHGQKYVFDFMKDNPGNIHRVYIGDSIIHEMSKKGDILVLSNGVQFEVVDKTLSELVTVVIKEGKIYNFCGIMIAGKYIENEKLSEADQNILSQMTDEVDFICPSFVDNVSVIDQIQKFYTLKRNQRIIAKIESPIGVRNMKDIAYCSDGIMLCRGDLSYFYDRTKIELLGHEMKIVTNELNKKLAFATDYFKSMVDGNDLSLDDFESLKNALKIKPDYIVLNETSYSIAWEKIARKAKEI